MWGTARLLFQLCRIPRGSALLLLLLRPPLPDRTVATTRKILVVLPLMTCAMPGSIVQVTRTVLIAIRVKSCVWKGVTPARRRAVSGVLATPFACPAPIILILLRLSRVRLATLSVPALPRVPMLMDLMILCENRSHGSLNKLICKKHGILDTVRSFSE